MVVPLSAARQPVFRPARGPEARARFAFKRVSLDATVAHRAGGARGCGVEDRTGILRAVRAEPQDLCRHAVVGSASHRATNDGNAHDFSVVLNAEAESVAPGRRRMRSEE